MAARIGEPELYRYVHTMTTKKSINTKLQKDPLKNLLAKILFVRFKIVILCNVDKKIFLSLNSVFCT